MLKHPAILLLAVFQCLAVAVIASPVEAHDCPPDQFSVGSHGECRPKYSTGSNCIQVEAYQCLSGVCDALKDDKTYGQCASICTSEETSKCGRSTYCNGEYCARLRQIGETCAEDKECASSNCDNKKCGHPKLTYNGVGEACNVADKVLCTLGTLCEREICRATGSNSFLDYLSYIDSIATEDLTQAQKSVKSALNLDNFDVVTNVNCSLDDYGHLCSQTHAYCDYSDNVCRAKKFLGDSCSYTRDGKVINSSGRCWSDRCVNGRCGTRKAGQKGDPCEKDYECTAPGLECRSIPTAGGSSVNVCDVPVAQGEGQKCKATSDCKGYLNWCYHGVCRDTEHITGASCKSDKECGGIERKKHDTAYQQIGFKCKNHKCKYYNCWDGSTGVSGFLGKLFGTDPSQECSDLY